MFAIRYSPMIGEHIFFKNEDTGEYFMTRCEALDYFEKKTHYYSLDYFYSGKTPHF